MRLYTLNKCQVLFLKETFTYMFPDRTNIKKITKASLWKSTIPPTVSQLTHHPEEEQKPRSTKVYLNPKSLCIQILFLLLHILYIIPVPPFYVNIEQVKNFESHFEGKASRSEEICLLFSSFVPSE